MCDRCPEKFKYEQRKKHWESCGVGLECEIEGCCIQGAPFKSMDALKTHCISQCEAIPLYCSVCEASLTRSKIASHSCEAGFISLLKMLKLRLKEAEEENAMLKAAP